MNDNSPFFVPTDTDTACYSSTTPFVSGGILVDGPSLMVHSTTHRTGEQMHQGTGAETGGTGTGKSMLQFDDVSLETANPYRFDNDSAPTPHKPSRKRGSDCPSYGSLDESSQDLGRLLSSFLEGEAGEAGAVSTTGRDASCAAVETFVCKDQDRSEREEAGVVACNALHRTAQQLQLLQTKLLVPNLTTDVSNLLPPKSHSGMDELDVAAHALVNELIATRDDDDDDEDDDHILTKGGLCMRASLSSSSSSSSSSSLSSYEGGGNTSHVATLDPASLTQTPIQAPTPTLDQIPVLTTPAPTPTTTTTTTKTMPNGSIGSNSKSNNNSSSKAAVFQMQIEAQAERVRRSFCCDRSSPMSSSSSSSSSSCSLKDEGAPQKRRRTIQSLASLLASDESRAANDAAAAAASATATIASGAENGQGGRGQHERNVLCPHHEPIGSIAIAPPPPPIVEHRPHSSAASYHGKRKIFQSGLCNYFRTYTGPSSDRCSDSACTVIDPEARTDTIVSLIHGSATTTNLGQIRPAPTLSAARADSDGLLSSVQSFPIATPSPSPSYYSCSSSSLSSSPSSSSSTSPSPCTHSSSAATTTTAASSTRCTDTTPKIKTDCNFNRHCDRDRDHDGDGDNGKQRHRCTATIKDLVAPMKSLLTNMQSRMNIEPALVLNRHSPTHAIAVTKNDVICGSGTLTNALIGNRRYRVLIELHARAYRDAAPTSLLSLTTTPSLYRRRRSVAEAVVRTVRSSVPAGRFLRLDWRSGLWVQVGYDEDEQATGAVAHAERALTERCRSLVKGGAGSGGGGGGVGAARNIKCGRAMAA